MLDAKMFEAIACSPSLTVPWYLITSYLYYQLDESVISDTAFDTLCHTMLDHWDEIDHRHKHLVSREALEAGTGHHITDYPEITKSAAERLLKEVRCTKAATTGSKNHSSRTVTTNTRRR